MPNLLINIVNGSWVAEVANTNIRYVFAGVDLPDQVQVVRGFAETMENDSPDVADFFINVNEPEIVGQQLFGTTDGIVFAGRPIFTTVGEDVLLDDLELAGEVLGTFV